MTAGREHEPAGQYRHRSVLLDSAVDLLVNDPDGVYVDGKLSVKGDMTGPKSAQIVLRDPKVAQDLVKDDDAD